MSASYASLGSSASAASLHERKMAKLRKIDAAAQIDADRIQAGVMGSMSVAGLYHSASRPQPMQLRAVEQRPSTVTMTSLPKQASANSLIPKNRFGQPLPQQAAMKMHTAGSRKAGAAMKDYTDMKYKSLTQAFRSMDGDGNRALDLDEVLKATLAWNLQCSQTEVEELIANCDENGDGKVDYGEFSRGLGRLMGEHKSQFGNNDSKVTSGFHQLGNQVIFNDNIFHAPEHSLHESQMVHTHALPAAATEKASKKELQNYMMQWSNKVETKYKKMQKAFREMDADKSGSLDRDEMVNAVQHLALPIPMAHVYQIFDSLADGNGDGKIEYNEFCQLMKDYDLQINAAE